MLRPLILRLILTLVPLFWTGSALAAELTEILQRGRLIVAVKDNLRPLGFRDGAGRLQGLEIDIARRLAQDLFGTPGTVTLKPVTNQNRLDAVLSGDVDLAIANVSTTANRLRLVNFSQPYYFNAIGVLTHHPQIQRLSDLAGRPVAVLNGSSTIAILRSAMPRAAMVGVDSYAAAQDLLDAGDVVAFCGDRAVLTGWVQQAPSYRLLPTQLSGRALAIVLPKGRRYESLRERINQSLRQWSREGWLRSRIQAWGLGETQSSTDSSHQFDRLDKMSSIHLLSIDSSIYE